MRRLALAICVTAALFLTGCDFEDWGDSNRYKEPFSYNGVMKPGARLFIESFNGSIDVLGWDRDAVEISGEKYAATQELLERLKIDLSAQPDSVRLRVIRPMERRGNCGARFTLRVPKHIIVDRIETSNGSVRAETLDSNLRMKTSNGSVHVYQVKGDVDASTSNASIEVTQFEGAAALHTSNGRIRAEGVRGSFEGTTSNASIDVNIVELAPGKTLRLDSSNGSINASLEKWNQNDIYADTSNSSINLRLPPALNARLKASTSNGSITTDYDVTVSSKSKTYLEGAIGSGGASIVLDTSNGNIRLMRR